MPGLIIAATGSAWNAGASILTFFAPVGLFCIVAAVLYLLFSRPHARVPAHWPLAPATGPESRAKASGAPREEPSAADGQEATE